MTIDFGLKMMYFVLKMKTAGDAWGEVHDFRLHHALHRGSVTGKQVMQALEQAEEVLKAWIMAPGHGPVPRPGSGAAPDIPVVAQTDAVRETETVTHFYTKRFFNEKVNALPLKMMIFKGNGSKQAPE